MAKPLVGWARVALIVWITASAHATRAQQQVVILDETYTATSANTSDSHYRLPPNDDAPDDWRDPVDYAAGRAHVRLEVIDKPSSAQTLYNVCFEATPTYACLPYSPEYTAEGVYDYEYPFSAFYQGNQVDWSQGTNQIALILKDHDEVKPQGDPDFYPTTIHVTITLLTEDAVYEPPSDEPEPELDAGRDAAIEDPLDAGPLDAATSMPDAAPPIAQPDAMPQVMSTAGTNAPTGGTGGAPAGAAGANGGGGAAGAVAMMPGSGGMIATAAPSSSSDAGCSIARTQRRHPNIVCACTALALGFALMRSARRPRRAPRSEHNCRNCAAKFRG